MIVLTGGARSGKSALAVMLADRDEGPVTFLATAAPGSGMEERIARHRRDRPEVWTTIEEPIEVARALEKVAGDETVVLDCITVWVNNLMFEDRSDDDIETVVEELADIAARRKGTTIVVTNEVGSGVHPATALGTRFQDLLGRVNAIVVGRAERAYLCVAGRPVPLPPPDDSWAK